MGHTWGIEVVLKLITKIQIANLIKQAQKEKKQVRINVKNNLYIAALVRPPCAKWLFKGRINGVYTSKFLGDTETTTLAKAEEKIKILKGEIEVPASYTVKQAFDDWAAKKKLTASSFAFMEMRINKYILDKFAGTELSELKPIDLINHWKVLERKGMSETLRKLCVYIKDIVIYAQNTGRVQNVHDLTHLKANYPPQKVQHMPALAPQRLSELFYILEKSPRVYTSVWSAFMTQLFTLSRPGEIAQLRWDWIDFEKLRIDFPAEVMKTRQPHSVPITKQLKKLLENISVISPFVFNSTVKKGEAINKESVRLMLNKAGLKGQQSAHGIRSIGSTWLAEQNYPTEICEACLAHVSASKVRRAYQRSEFLEQRREIMQAWCDYVESCRAAAHEKILKEQVRDL